MKVVAFSCSPRVNGNCDVLIEETLRGINDKHGNIEVDKYKVANLNINDCMACGRCKTSNGCGQRDDMQRIYDDIYKSDVIVFASPIYMGYITGNGKNLIDRMYAFDKGHYEIDIPKGKKIIIILTQEHVREDAYRKVIDDLTNFFNGYGIEVSGRIIYAGASSSLNDVKKEVLNIAYKTGNNI